MKKLKDKIYRERVEVIIIKDNKVLLGVRSKPTERYTYPGGGLDGKTIEQTIIEECLEEVGIQVNGIKNTNVVGISNVPPPAKNDGRDKYDGSISYYYVARYHKENKKLYDRENDALPYIWVPFEEAVDLFENTEEHEWRETDYKRLEALQWLISNHTLN